jgi:hypothetical protein
MGAEGGGDGVDGSSEVAARAEAAAVVMVAVESASARTTLSTAWRRGCATETRVSCARYDGHPGSSGGAGTYDAMGS